MSEDERAASCTIEPSRPMDPPLAMVMSDDRLRQKLCHTGIMPSPMVTASM